jgi:hypothetical protein
VNVEVLFAYVQQVMLGGVSETINRLQQQDLFVLQEFNVGIAMRFSDAFVEAYSLFGSGLPNLRSFVKDPSLEKHLERMVKKNQNGFDAPAIGRTIEVLRAKK